MDHPFERKGARSTGIEGTLWEEPLVGGKERERLRHSYGNVDDR
jgi:hypothetical protein